MAEEKSLTDKTLGGFLWLGGSSGIKAVIQVVVVGILARLLEPSDFGIVAAAMVVILFTEMLYEMGVGPALIQMKEITPTHERTGLAFSVLLGVTLAGLFYFINPFIAAFYGMPDLTEVLNLLVWIFPLRTFSQISYSLLQRDLKFKKLAGLDLVSYFFGYGLVGIGLAAYGLGVWSLVWANIVQAATYSLLLGYVKRPLISVTINLRALKELLSYGGTFTIASLLNFGARKADYVIVGKVLGGSALGIYSRAYGLMNAPNNVAGTVMTKVLFGSLSSIQDDSKRIATALDKSYELLFLGVLPLSGLCYVLAPEIVSILLGAKWMDTVAPFRILVLSMVFRIGYKIGAVYLTSTGKINKHAIIQLTYLVNVVVGSIIGAQYGVSGVAMGVTFAILINFIVLTYQLVANGVFHPKLLLTRSASALPALALVVVTSYLTADRVRLMTESDLLVAVAVVSLTALFLILGIYYTPKVFLGKHGQDVLSFVVKAVKHRTTLNPLKR